MSNINHQRAGLFAQNRKQDNYFFTSDDQGFYNGNDAAAHAAKLKDTAVDELTRAAVDEWVKAENPRLLAEAKNELTDATNALAEAEKAKDALGAVPKVPALMAANKVVNRAKMRVAAAQVAVDELEGECGNVENVAPEGNVEGMKEATGRKVILTQEDLDRNPDLAAQGCKVGDEVELGPEFNDGTKKPNIGLLKAAVTRAVTALEKANAGGDAAVIAAALEKMNAANAALSAAQGATPGA